MNKKEIKKIIKSLRQEQNGLWKKYDNHNIHIEISIEAITGEIMEDIPHALNLKTGEFCGRDLIDGKYKKVKLWKKRLKE